MKKIFKMIVIVIVILFLGILTLFCIKINKISLIENIRQKIAQVGENIQTANEITTIDVTDLEDNGDLEHEHIIKTMYDENKHWEECNVCGVKMNVNDHSYTTTWSNGSESCYYTNSYRKVCSCGYSIEGHKPCVWDGKSYIQQNMVHFRKCSKC